MGPVFRFAEAVFGSLETAFAAGAPNEVGAFMLVGFADTPGGVQLYSREVLTPPADAWRTQEPARLAPSTAWMSHALGLADREKLGLAFIHSHPVGIGGPWFSGADEWMHEAMVPAMVANLEGRPFASLVYCGGQVSGAVWFGGARHAFERVAVAGNRLMNVEPGGSPAREPGAFGRQVLMWGQQGQHTLAQLRVGVVGAGGTGSAVAEQLVRSGVGPMIVVDPDVLEGSNVTRVYGSTARSVGRNKAENLAEHLRGIWGSRVEGLPLPVEDRRAVEALVRCDVVFGCTDNHASRAVINDIAVQHLVPVIDVGCRIGSHEGRTRGIGCEARLIRPGGPCYYCGGVITAQSVRQDALPPDERQRLEQEGYVKGLTEEPSIIPVTTVTAGLGVLRFLDLALGVLGWEWPRILADLHVLDMFGADGHSLATCHCSERLGIGDRRRIWLLDTADGGVATSRMDGWTSGLRPDHDEEVAR